MRSSRRDVIDRAAAELRRSSRAFTAANLYYAVLRAEPELRERCTLEAFRANDLRRRLRRGPIAGLLPDGGLPSRRVADIAGPEWDACFPAGILLVDRPAIVDLFVASGALVQTRIAVVCVDGTPARVVKWLKRGLLRGHRAPVGYLHDERTVLYPFFYEPLATLTAVTSSAQRAYRDLGIGPGRSLRDPLGVARAVATQAACLEELPPSSLVAYAAQELLGMIPGDPMLLPLTEASTGAP